MKNAKFALLAAALFIITSCSMQKKLETSVGPEDIHDIQQFEPLAYIRLIKKGNTEQFNDSLSVASKQLMQKTLDGYKDQIPITGKAGLTNLFENDKLENEIELLFSEAETQKLSKIKITPIVDSLLESQGKRFGMMTLSSGFTRARFNYGKQVALGFLIGLISMGTYIETPLKASSSVHIIIVDAQENNLVFYRKSEVADGEPLSSAVIEKQLHTIFRKYFFEK